MPDMHERAYYCFVPSGGLLTVKEAAAVLGRHRNTVTRWADTGVLTVAFRTAGGAPRFRRSDIEALVGIEPDEVAS